MSITSRIRSLPLLGALSRKLVPPRSVAFDGSGAYWERRYRTGGNSGAGSYNRLARFKARFLNDFVRREGIGSVIEFGCGDGAQLALAEYPAYIGVDVSPTVLAKVRHDYASVPQYAFRHTSEVGGTTADLALSLDVIYHLVEDAVFEAYMHALLDAARRWTIVYSSNQDKPWSSPHVRHRRFTDWIAARRPDWTLVEHVPNAYPFAADDQDNTSFADFFVFAKASPAG